MTVRLTLRVGDDERKFAFDRREVTVGSGPFNDVVVDADEVARVVGAFEVEGGEIRFRSDGGDGAVRLVRDGEAVDRWGAEREESRRVDVGDSVRVGDTPEVVVTVADVETSSDDAPFELLELLSSDEVEPEDEVTRLLWRATRALSREPGIERLLRVVGGVVHEAFEGELDEAILTLADDHGRGTDYVFRIDFTDGPPRSLVASGDWERERAPLMGLGADRGRLLAKLRNGEHFAVHADDSRGESVFYPVGDRAFVGMLDLRFRAGGAPRRERLDRLGALLEPLARMAIDAARERFEKLSLAEENRYFRERERRQYLFKDLVSESEAMREVYETVDTWVGREAPVLITGEAGVGKSLVARAFHHLGPREDGMLIRLDCRELSEEVLEAELFGCVESELVDAVAPRKGVFELADQGTVFLDEIDLLPSRLQRKLLRVVNEREVRRIGDAVGRPVDTRLIASTHRDLGAEVERGSFRRDLYLRLRDHVLEVPPLREREKDILPMARVFLQKFANRYDRPVEGFDDEVERRLQSHSWPGNVRELKTVVESAVLQTDDEDEVLRGEHLDFRSGRVTE